jgi:hypothetical protein
MLPLLGVPAARAFEIPEEIELPPRLRQEIEKLDLEKYRVVAEPVGYGYQESGRADLRGWSSFEDRYGRGWRLEVDRRTGAPLLIEGQGIPLFPGPGNELDRAAYGPAAAGEPRLDDVAAAARAFLEQHQELLGIADATLELDQRASRALDAGGLRWNVRLDQVVRDPALGTIPVSGAHVFFRIGGGNLLQFGNQFVIAPGALETGGLISRQDAEDAARALAGSGRASSPPCATSARTTGRCWSRSPTAHRGASSTSWCAPS